MRMCIPVSQPFNTAPYKHQSMDHMLLSMSDLKNQLMGDVDGILECFDITVSLLNNFATETLVFVNYQAHKRLRSSPNIIFNDQSFDFSTPVDLNEITSAEIINQAESLLKNGKLFIPTNVDNRLSDKTATTSVIVNVRVPQPSVLES